MTATGVALPVRAAARVATPGRAAPLAGGAVLSFGLAATVLRGDPALAAALAGVAGAAVLLAVPRLGVVALVVLLGTVLPSRVLPVSAAGVRTDLPELVAGGLLGVWVVLALRGSHARPSRFAWPLALVAVATASGAIVGVLDGATRSEVLGPAKSLIFWLLPLPLAAVIATRSDHEWLERLVLAVATAGSVAVLALLVVGADVPAAEPTEVVTLGTTAEVARVRPALLQLLFLATLLALHRIAFGGASVARIAQVGLFAAVQVLSLTRSTWVPLVLCALLFVAVRPGRRRPLRGLTAVVAVVTVVGGGLSLAAAGALGPHGEAVALRAGSVANPEVLDEGSWEDRADETGVAIETLERNPVFGVGLARPYGARRGEWASTWGHVVYSDRLFIHNSYLGLWLGLGLPGVVAIAALGVAAVRHLAGVRRQAEAVVASRALCGGLALLGMALQATMQTKLHHRPSILVAALALTLLDAPLRGSGARGEAA